MAKNSLALPDKLIQLLSAAESRHGLPAGTMYSVMQQEIGGQQRFLDDPTAYHYEADAKGKRIAPHTGKVSTAFGPFGILESTAKDPGFGVAPLANKSLEEQVRFASDYLKARGLANYGEGEKYAAQVRARIPGQAPAPVQMAAAPAAAAPQEPSQITQPVVVADAQPVIADRGAVLPAPMNAEQDAWQQFLAKSADAGVPVTPPGVTRGRAAVAPAPGPVQLPQSEDFAQLAAMELATRPSFTMFQGLAKLGRRTA